MGFFRRLIKFDKKVYKLGIGGGAAKKGLALAKKNPKLAAAAATSVGGPLAGTAVSGLLGGFGGFGSSPYEAQPEPAEPAPDPGLVAGIDTKTLLIAGAGVVALVLVTRK